MNVSRRNLYCWMLLGLFTALAGVASADDRFFRPLGEAPGGAVFSFAHALSPEGGVVVGRTQHALGIEACVWGPDGELELLGEFGGGAYMSVCRGVARNGELIVGNGSGPDGLIGFLYAPGAELTPLSDLLPGRDALVCHDVTPDGRYIVGYDNDFTTGFRFDVLTGAILDLPFLSGSFFERATGVSADGLVIVGQASLPGSAVGAIYWTPQSSWQLVPETVNSGACTAVSADGSTIVGVHRVQLTTGNGEAFVWRRGYPLRSILDLPGGAQRISTSDVSADGRVVVGSAEDESGPIAVVWTRNAGLRTVASLLAGSLNVDLQGWRLEGATGVSEDGRTICGNGRNPQGFTEAWVARIPSPCFEDLNGDNSVNNIDLGILLGSWRQTSDLADVNLDSIVDATDIAILLGSWGPCP